MRKSAVYSFTILAFLGALTVSVPAQTTASHIRGNTVDMNIRNTAGNQVSSERAQKLLDLYTKKLQNLESKDKAIGNLIDKSAPLQGQELSDYIKTLIPQNDALIKEAKLVTSTSPALREVQEEFISYLEARGYALNLLKDLALKSSISVYMRSFMVSAIGGCDYTGFAGSYDKSHIPAELNDTIQKLRDHFDDQHIANNTYRNKMNRIKQSPQEYITEDRKDSSI